MDTRILEEEDSWLLAMMYSQEATKEEEHLTQVCEREQPLFTTIFTSIISL